jgi:hypothetical protein
MKTDKSWHYKNDVRFGALLSDCCKGLDLLRDGREMYIDERRNLVLVDFVNEQEARISMAINGPQHLVLASTAPILVLSGPVSRQGPEESKFGMANLGLCPHMRDLQPKKLKHGPRPFNESLNPFHSFSVEVQNGKAFLEKTI